MRRYGNVSSSSIWYVLANIETMQARPLSNERGSALPHVNPALDGMGLHRCCKFCCVLK